MPVVPEIVLTSLPVETSQSLILWSALPERRLRPFGLKATELTAPVWPVSACALLLSDHRQILMTCPASAEAIRWPSGLKATAHTAARCPISVASSFPEARSHILTV